MNLGERCVHERQRVAGRRRKVEAQASEHSSAECQGLLQVLGGLPYAAQRRRIDHQKQVIRRIPVNMNLWTCLRLEQDAIPVAE